MRCTHGTQTPSLECCWVGLADRLLCSSQSCTAALTTTAVCVVKQNRQWICML
jgi:hypothetical protein